MLHKSQVYFLDKRLQDSRQKTLFLGEGGIIFSKWELCSGGKLMNVFDSHSHLSFDGVFVMVFDAKTHAKN